MPLVSLESSAQEALLQKQRRNSVMVSLLISMLVLGLMALIMAIIFLPSLFKEVPVMVAYNAPSQSTEQVEQKKKTRIVTKPTAPSSQSRVITANTASPLAIPVPELELDASEVSMDFGAGDDFGAGFEMADDGAAGGGMTTFFKQEVVAQRIAYVIDASGSMTPTQQELMRDEMKKSLKQLQPPIKYQIIFFSAPAWVAGSEQDFGSSQFKEGKASFTDDSGTYRWTGGKGRYQGWKPKGKEQPVPWIEISSRTRRDSIEQIENQRMYAGTDWVPPMVMALNMDPPPEIIFFMTDGGYRGAPNDVPEIVKLARRKKTIINTVALMVPQAEQSLADIAKATKGQFTVVDKRGRAEVKDLKDY